ncbi:MAG: hypothetical protein KC940_20830 [Candidatus Omnitrophica bacterium]|nr:hypothetical protein [Candidatus Omnitrophota bacterium]
MLEIIQWIAVGLLGGCVGWLWRDRLLHRSPAWLREVAEEDLVRQSDLDQYHHRVVQLSHTQRDLLLKKIESLDTRLAQLQKQRAGDEPSLLSSNRSQAPNKSAPEPSPNIKEPMTPAPSMEPLRMAETAPEVEEPVVEETVETEEETMSVFEPVSDQDQTSFDPTSRVLRMWNDGKRAEEIARELRMGRQEVQLLIEMSRHSTLGVTRG